MIQWPSGSIPRAVEADWVGDGTGIKELEQIPAKRVRAQGQPGLQVGGCLHHETARRRTGAAEAKLVAREHGGDLVLRRAMHGQRDLPRKLLEAPGAE
jgi:hypothetical protein